MTDPVDPRASRESARAQAGGADPLVGKDPVAAAPAGSGQAAPARRDVGGALLRAWRASAVPILSIVLALVIGAIIIVLSPLTTGKPIQPDLPIRAYLALLEGAFGTPVQWADDARRFNAIGDTLVKAAPLMFGGLAVGLAFKAGLFNIGVAGQFLVGAFAAALAGATFGYLDTNFAVPLAVTIGGLAGAAYGFIPGFLKARTGAHEVVTTIMLNAIALQLLAWALDLVKVAGFSFPRTGDIVNATLPVLFGRNIHLGVLLGFLAIFVIRWLLDRTTLGFEIRTVGANPNAARYAGIRPVFIITLTMTLSGLLGGLAGAVQMLGVQGFYATGISAKVGFDSITVALLGRSSPLGIMFSALLFGVLRAGQNLMQLRTQNQVPIEVIDVIQALIILFLAADIIVRRVFRLRRAKGAIEGEVRTVTASWGEQVAR
ncbi:MAG TPA: ABC transporter permease [Candidatus Limnocylindrales bacterium]|jgi:simple sugar transport system permease protein|nr:ABC transporter permease [Candidatus Limnocylindrales bacterium]